MPISEKTLDFLMENRLRDSRIWYQEHREDYRRYVQEPMADLVERLAPVALEIDPEIVTLPVSRCISRIHRDLRFSKDKTLYRDSVWCVFMRDKKEYRCPPAFFFEASPQGFQYGCGYYDIPAENMRRLRELILRGDRSYSAMRRAYRAQELFTLEGELYRRNHYPGESKEKQFWLNRKNLGFIRYSEDFDLLFSQDLWETLAEGFRLLRPMYDFFRRGLVVNPNAL